MLVSLVVFSRPFSLEEPPLFNPARGYSLAVLLFFGYSYSLPLFLGSLISNLYFLKHSLWAATLYALTNIWAMSFTVFLTKRFCRPGNIAFSPRDWVIFLAGVIPLASSLRFLVDVVILQATQFSFKPGWTGIYLEWLWIDLLGVILVFPFFMELFDFFKIGNIGRLLRRDLFPFLVGNLLGIFVFFNPGFDSYGLPTYLPFYLSLTGMIGIAYYTNPMLLSFSLLLQGLCATWGRDGIIERSGLNTDQGLWALRVFMFSLGIMTPILSSLFGKSHDDALKKSFLMVSSALNPSNTENDLIRVASKSDTVAVGVFDMNYRVLHLNEKFAEIAGTPLETQIGKTSQERIGPNSRHMAEVYEQLKTTGKPIWNYRLSFEAWQQMRQQERLCNYIPIFSKAGEVVGVIVVSTEISEGVTQEFGVRTDSNSDRNINNMMSLAVSHDLQEPLRNVNQALKILNEKFKNNGNWELRSFVESALDASSKVHHMLKGSLELARLDYEKIEFHDLSFDLLVQEVARENGNYLDPLGAQVRIESAVHLKADKELLRRLIQNLFSNSLKYRSEKPLVITISGSIQGQMAHLNFSDNGRGFPHADRERIFTPYQRLHSDKEILGYGLGLPICKKIVELHGGRIWAESQPGQGATFHFTLPVA